MHQQGASDLARETDVWVNATNVLESAKAAVP